MCIALKPDPHKESEVTKRNKSTCKIGNSNSTKFYYFFRVLCFTLYTLLSRRDDSPETDVIRLPAKPGVAGSKYVSWVLFIRSTTQDATPWNIADVALQNWSSSYGFQTCDEWSRHNPENTWLVFFALFGVYKGVDWQTPYRKHLTAGLSSCWTTQAGRSAACLPLTPLFSGRAGIFHYTILQGFWGLSGSFLQ